MLRQRFAVSHPRIWSATSKYEMPSAGGVVFCSNQSCNSARVRTSGRKAANSKRQICASRSGRSSGEAHVAAVSPVSVVDRTGLRADVIEE